MERTDEQFIEEHLEGNPHALGVLINRHLASIYNYTYVMTGSSADAEDITQETFVKVWRHIKKYRPQQSFKTWLFTIAHRTAIDWLRKRKHLHFSDFDDDEDGNTLTEKLADTQALPDEVLARAYDKAFLEKMLLTLHPRYREVLNLYYFEELTFDEIGTILRKPLNTVKSQHRRALIALRKNLDAPKLNEGSLQ